MLEAKDSFVEKVDLEQILAAYRCGCKSEELHKVGIEFERLPISSITNKMVDYSKENGIYDLLRAFAKLDGWEYITDDYSIVGLKKGEDRITLEPGCQFELSLNPEKNIASIKTKIDNFNKKITLLQHIILKIFL